MMVPVFSNHITLLIASLIVDRKNQNNMERGVLTRMAKESEDPVKDEKFHT